MLNSNFQEKKESSARKSKSPLKQDNSNKSNKIVRYRPSSECPYKGVNSTWCVEDNSFPPLEESSGWNVAQYTFTANYDDESIRIYSDYCNGNCSNLSNAEIAGGACYDPEGTEISCANGAH